MNLTEEQLDLYREALFPYAHGATLRAQRIGGRFVYYTTASTAMLALRSRKLWMRNTQVMNDFTEVEHGMHCIREAFKSSAGASFDEAVNSYFPGLAQEIRDGFFAWSPGILRDTYVTCISEHSRDEDEHGRLSMWRAYGGDAGVALVIKGDVLFRPSDALAAYSSPVAYLDGRGIREQLEQVAGNIKTNVALMSQFDREGMKGAMFHMLRFAAVCTKHPAFLEEREWRIISSPTFGTSEHLESEFVSIGGIPQKVLKIPLEDFPEQGLYGLSPDQLIERVLIGPMEHSGVVIPALLDAMKSAGISDPVSKIFDTGIPLRPNQR